MEKVKKQGMESFFCPYELALELKELGFDEISLFYYDAAYEGNPLSHCPHLLLNSQLEGFENEPISAPLWQQAFRFFREKYKLHSRVFFDRLKELEETDEERYDFDIVEQWTIGKDYFDYSYGFKHLHSSRGIYMSYEEAELACLVKLIDIAKEQNVK